VAAPTQSSRRSRCCRRSASSTSRTSSFASCRLQAFQRHLREASLPRGHSPVAPVAWCSCSAISRPASSGGTCSIACFCGLGIAVRRVRPPGFSDDRAADHALGPDREHRLRSGEARAPPDSGHWSCPDGIIVSWVVPIVVAVIIVNGALSHGSSKRACARRRASSGSAHARVVRRGRVPHEPLRNPGCTADAAAGRVEARCRRERVLLIPWLASTALSVVLWNVGVSFVVEVVTAAENAAQLLRRSIQIWGLVVSEPCWLRGDRPLVLPLVGHGIEPRGGAAPLGGDHRAVLVGLGALPILAWLDRRVWWLLAVQWGRARCSSY